MRQETAAAQLQGQDRFVDSEQSAVRTKAGLAGLKAAFLAETDARVAKLAGVKCPALVIHGDVDAVIDVGT